MLVRRVSVAALIAGTSALFPTVPALAQSCTFTQSPMSFGQITPRNNVAFDTTATLNISCTGNALSTVLICPHLGPGSGGGTAAARQMVNGANSLNYQIYSNIGRTTVWGSYNWAAVPQSPAYTILLVLGAGSLAVTQYGRVFAGQQTVNGGLYTSTFTGSNIEYRYRYNDGLGCTTGAGTLVSPTLTVTADVLPNCSVTATDVNFASRGVLNTNTDQTGTLSVSCTSGTPYTVALNGGQSNMAPTARRMSKGGVVGGEFVTYGLYTDAARSQAWGSAAIGGSTVPGTGTGTVQNIPVYARVPSQTTPSAGAYSDVVVVTVTY